MILPLGARTGAETEATPCSRSPTDCAQPRRRMPDSAVAEYADGVGPEKSLVLPRGADGATSQPSALVADAHAAGLLVHVYTLRQENQFMATNFRRGADPVAPGDLAAEVRAFLDAGVDGFFTDHPDVAVAARDAWLEGRS